MDRKEALKSDGQSQGRESTKRLYLSLLLALIALLSAVAATAAWFSIADRTKVQSLDMQVTSGVSLRFDLDPHEEFYDYIKTLTFADIQARIVKDLGYDLEKVPLEPVTTKDCITYTYGDDTAIQEESGVYLTFVLNFMALEDMNVHLTSANSKKTADGTLITSKVERLPESMRISFTTDEGSVIYDPGIGNTYSVSEEGVKTFGLLSAEEMEYNEGNVLFHAKANVNKPVTVHIWIEGNDEACTDALREADYQIRMRFMGTDAQYNPVSENE